MPKDGYRELCDAIEVAVQQNGRNRAQRRRLRTLIREQLAERLEVALERAGVCESRKAALRGQDPPWDLLRAPMSELFGQGAASSITVVPLSDIPLP
jgi:hypothetical protein